MVTPVALYHRLPSLQQRRRRIAVLAAFAGLPLLNIGYVALVETGVVPTTLWGPIAVALFGITLIGVIAIYGWGQGRIREGREELDERERAMVD